MIILPEEHNKQETFLRIVKKEDIDSWNIFFGSSYEGRRSTVYHEAVDDVTEPIIMVREDLRCFSQEVNRILLLRPADRTELNLTFRQNNPQFKVRMRFMEKGNPIYRERLRGKVEFSAGFNINYSAIRYTREEDQYLYENGGGHVFKMRYYDPQELERFADELERV